MGRSAKVQLSNAGERMLGGRGVEISLERKVLRGESNAWETRSQSGTLGIGDEAPGAPSQLIRVTLTLSSSLSLSLA